MNAFDPLVSAELARRLALNPHNIGGNPKAPHMCAMDYARAQFEAQGRAAYPLHANPHNRGTAAAEWWEVGFQQAASGQAFRMCCDSEPFGPSLLDRDHVTEWFWSDCGKAAFQALPGIHDRPPCGEAQAVFAARNLIYIR